MRQTLVGVLLAAALAGGCGGDTTGPAQELSASLEDLAALGYGALQLGDPRGGPGIVERLNGLPPELALTAEQSAQIGALIEAHIAATAADRDALAAVLREAAEARAAGASPTEVRAILERGAEIRRRLHESELALSRSILGVLTPAQRAWLAGRTPPPPRPCALTEAQRTEISALLAAFEQAHAADLALIRSVHERARAARDAGATREAIAAILAEARDAVQRVQQARAAVQQAIQAVLTPEQRAAGCMR